MKPQTVVIDSLEVSIATAAKLPVHSLDHHLHAHIAKACHIPVADVLHYTIDRRSLDARRKPDLRFIYNLRAEVRENSPVSAAENIHVQTASPPQDNSLYNLALRGDLPQHPIIVGAGPAGQMAAYLLSLHGCKPLVLDRGFDADARTRDIAAFHSSRQLNEDSNYLFGEGGAGTYSDGKLYTRVKDRRMRFLLEAFVAARAPRHILYRHHPHIGSDILPHMCKHLRAQIEQWGGRFRWGATVRDVVVEQDRCAGVELTTGERIAAPLVLIAPGHSARALILALIARGIEHKAKGFQLGCRIEHDQELVNYGQYGCHVGRDIPAHLLGAAEYNLVSRPPAHIKAENVTTFCMCPGGEIIAATSDPGQLSTNGMSRYARSSPFANAGLIVNQAVDRSGNGMAGFELINALEQAAYTAGGADFSCPAQTATAFMRGEVGSAVTRSSYRLGVRPGRIDQLLPQETVTALRQALRFFEKVIPGFMTHGNLVGVETRVSSPVRFERNPETLASSLPELYLAGEGAGYAGGIVSAGLDGLRLAETILTGLPAVRER